MKLFGAAVAIAVLLSACGGDGQTSQSDVAAADQADDAVAAMPTSIATDQVEGGSQAADEQEDSGVELEQSDPVSSELIGLSPDETAELLWDIVGPTDDFASQVSRLYPFPAIATPPEARIDGTQLSLFQTSRSQSVELVTTLTPSEAIEFMGSELERLGFEPGAPTVSDSGESFEIELEDLSVFTQMHPDFGLDPDIPSTDTQITIRLRVRDTGDMTGIVDEIVAAAPSIDGQEPDEVFIAFALGSPRIQVQVPSGDLTIQELVDSLVERTTPLGWTPLEPLAIAEDAEFGIDFDSPHAVRSLSVSIREGITGVRENTQFNYPNTQAG